MKVPCRYRPAHGLTLIEVLAVIVVLGLLAAAVVPGLAAAGENARLREAAFRGRELDGKARLLARSGTPCTLSVDQQGRLQLLDAGEQVVIASSPPETGVMYVLPGPIVFDLRGRSEDYLLTIQIDDISHMWSCAGLTGLFESMEPIS